VFQTLSAGKRWQEVPGTWTAALFVAVSGVAATLSGAMLAVRMAATIRRPRLGAAIPG